MVRSVRTDNRMHKQRWDQPACNSECRCNSRPRDSGGQTLKPQSEMALIKGLHRGYIGVI